MTGRFNLLPYREMQRLWARRVLVRQAGLAAGCGVLVALLYQQFVTHEVQYWRRYNMALGDAIQLMMPDALRAEALERQRADMLQKRALMEILDARRTASVQILNDLARAVPRGVYLERLDEDGENFRIEGRASEAALVGALFESLLRSVHLSGLSLEEIRLSDGAGHDGVSYGFILTGSVDLSATLRQPATEDTGGGAR